ncbi:AbrB/MazE/SpoVT family DNA-binding domain-containing protein [Candidatus Heimdallarchaeota archaeon]|nr:MAG: AbrB/MazE/SpoVT family DNA-binding domain-containing protein [Candidatus Heimdallarchaeota archaeon]
MGTVEIDERGRITIPKEERERLGLKPGEKLMIIEKDGELIIRKIITSDDFINNLKGCITKEEGQFDPLELKEIWEGNK